MARLARAILAALCASVAAPATPATPTATAIVSPPKHLPPKQLRRSSEPKMPMVVASAQRLKRSNGKKLIPVVLEAALSLDLYPLADRRLVKLGGKHDVATRTRITLKEELARGAFGTVLSGEYTAPDGQVHAIAVKRMLTANTEEVLTVAIHECTATVDVGGLEKGVLPCYGVVLGPGITKEWLASNMPALRQGDRAALIAPLVVGRWSDNRSNGWNVALLEPLVEGAVNGSAFADDSFFAPEASKPATSRLHSALSAHKHWRFVPAAIVVCVTRAARFLAENYMWHGNIKPSNMLFTPDFAARPFAPENCLLIGFEFAVHLVRRQSLYWASPGYLHPQALDFYPQESEAHHHALDVFQLSTTATRLILGGVGHPVLRCMRKDERLRAASLIKSPSGIGQAKRAEIGERLADLGEIGMRDIAEARVDVCRKMGSMVVANGAITREEARGTYSRFRDSAVMFGWTNADGSLGSTPELAAVASLFQLTAGRTLAPTRKYSMKAYDKILQENVMMEVTKL